MAHIADLLVETQNSVGLNKYIARELSPHPSSPHDASTQISNLEEKEKYVWRMHQPADTRKYQLFPKEKAPAAQPTSNPETTTSTTKNQQPTSAPRMQPKEQTLVRRRKVSVPELGPMTTVQEVAMDSPTIPGRPPLHERSISAPGNNSWRQNVFGDTMLSCISGPAFDENAEMAMSPDYDQAQRANIPSHNQTSSNSSSRSASPKQPISPKKPTPLVIPSTTLNRIPRKQLSSNRLRSGSTPPNVPPKSARMEVSPHPRGTPSPYTPMSASSAGLLSASTAPTSATTTPHISSPYTPEGRSSPKPSGHSRNQSEAPSTAASFSTFPMHPKGHRRTESETSIMDRGRPKKRPEGKESSPIKRTISIKRTPPPSLEEQRAFEYLPTGHSPSVAPSHLPASELLTLRTQAIGQASRFQVLSSNDVTTLSRELRALDERCEYLRKTHKSLRSGRRNLHERIVSYLRSPRTAKFSHESMLKQEEALWELDNSIDDWVSKLEQAENRRMRVRQKLLEHVAAALILSPSSPSTSPSADINSGKEGGRFMHLGNLERDPNTPPRSPTKAQSPERLERVVEEVKSTSPDTRRGGREVESIRIYADSDISALLKDVEEEINRMGEAGENERVEKEKKEKEEKMKEVINAGTTLQAVAFEGMLVHQRSQQLLKKQQSQGQLSRPAFV